MDRSEDVLSRLADEMQGRAFVHGECGIAAEIIGWSKRLRAFVTAGWQPIETAPKDCQILGWSSRYGARETRWTLYGEGSTAKESFDRGDGPEGYWDWSEPMHNWGSSWKPTHWQPLSTIIKEQP